MFRPTMQRFSHRLLPFIALALLSSLTSGCATRVLMSSDRYEKPKTDTPQFRSLDAISRSWQQDSHLEQAYLSAAAQVQSIQFNRLDHTPSHEFAHRKC